MPRAALSTDEVEAFRGRICDAAAHLFAEQGYEAVTLRAIATAVGCSPMTPYRYFPGGKEEIFTLVRAFSFRRFADAQLASIERVRDPADRVATLGWVYIDFALEHPDQYRLMFELAQPDAEHPELLAEGLRAWAPLQSSIAAAIDAGLFRGDVDTVAHVFLGRRSRDWCRCTWPESSTFRPSTTCACRYWKPSRVGMRARVSARTSSTVWFTHRRSTFDSRESA